MEMKNRTLGGDNRIPIHSGNEAIDEILRGEISAVEAYRSVIGSFDKDPEVFRLQQFKNDHENSVRFWKRQARIIGKIPQKTSRVWGGVVDTIIGGASLVSERATLVALKKGEEFGVSKYKDMLEHPKLSKFQKEEIRQRYIPMQEKHIRSIKSLMALAQ